MIASEEFSRGLMDLCFSMITWKPHQFLLFGRFCGFQYESNGISWAAIVPGRTELGYLKYLTPDEAGRPYATLIL